MDSAGRPGHLRRHPGRRLVPHGAPRHEHGCPRQLQPGRHHRHCGERERRLPLRVRCEARRGRPLWWGPVSPPESRMDQVFKAYDIRGTVPDQLDADMCLAIGRAMARFAGSPQILVARDMRESGVELASAFSDGVRAEGVDIIDLGMASTDFLYFASGHLKSPGAMFTASHNPAQYNGLKLCLSGARPIGRDTGLADIEAQAEKLCGEPVPPLTGGRRELDLSEEWADHVVSFVD